ncbi:UDP-N-acetylmuramate--L-alanine ligase [Almyronema epifaneia]|uniref:UDP-N-acetylmuramate--L-alanine ligase n=1 Tax=Almyronema epifaneia S1 TaxID=2991925 RepID=A0ABW6IHK0_9CYAN
MLNSVDFSGRPFHFIGVGGIGMSALAYILARCNLPVTGSDVRLSHITKRLQDEGVHIFWQQQESNLSFFQTPQAIAAPASRPSSAPPLERNSAVSAAHESRRRPAGTSFLPQVICSTAIDKNNSEYRAAIELGCPIFHRSDLLAALIAQYKGIAVAGTHGKTTTSSLIGYLLLKANLDPTIIVGGEVAAWEGNAHLGQGDYLVAEADESDGSLVKLSAHIGVITNIELDHPDHYSTLEQVVSIFDTFAQSCQTVVGCIDCQTVRQSIQPDVTYSLDPETGADYVADEITHYAGGTVATVWEKGRRLGQITLPLLGRHNLSNALAAIAVGRLVGLDFATIAEILSSFQGARRRFEQRGFHNGILFVDDYAHHPSEIRATLAAARIKASEEQDEFPGRRVIAVFQPHRYSRTATLLAEFAEAFSQADQVIVTDIYSAGEKNAYDISGYQVTEAIAKHHTHAIYRASLAEVTQALKQGLQTGDIVLFLTAGNLNQVIPDVMSYYQQHNVTPLAEAAQLA